MPNQTEPKLRPGEIHLLLAERHLKCCKAHSSIQESLSEENDDHEEPESWKAFQSTALSREGAHRAAQALPWRCEASHVST